MSTMRRCCPAGVLASAGKLSRRPSTPSTDSRPPVIMRMRSGAALMSPSSLSGRMPSHSISVATSRPPSAVMSESVPEPVPNM